MPLPTHIPHVPGSVAWHFATCDTTAELEEFDRIIAGEIREEIRSPLSGEDVRSREDRRAILKNRGR